MKAPGGMSSFDDRWDDNDGAKSSLAERINGGRGGSNDLLGRMGGQSLADRFS